MKARKTLIALCVISSFAAGGTTIAGAEPNPGASPRTEQTSSTGTTNRTPDSQASNDPVIATYKGRKINLSLTWGHATVCSEYPDLSVKCFDNDSQARADLAAYKKHHPSAFPAVPKHPAGIRPKAAGIGNHAGAKSQTATAPDSCAYGWVCIYQHDTWNENNDGRKLQWSAEGKKTLGKYGFRDETSSTCNNNEIGGMDLIDYRNNLPDPRVPTQLRTCIEDLEDVDYPGWGTGSWGDRADAVEF
ncbi:hypothetical protein ACFPA8_23380 [Streptomyces ovatisporus]|uniref:Secreted protein n=1 Tax=Streptomyces ovatisporus TaxID=1128682 RepID=A0ABV9AAZ7_9ACTN